MYAFCNDGKYLFYSTTEDFGKKCGAHPCICKMCNGSTTYGRKNEMSMFSTQVTGEAMLKVAKVSVMFLHHQTDTYMHHCHKKQ
jgi:hypothetical protein